jgi:hypothetical protein
MFSITYGINLLAASIAKNDDAGWLWVPGVGSWPLVGDECDRSGNDQCEILVLHSLVHSIGLALIIYGVAARKQVLVRQAVSLELVPARIGTGEGLALRGAF